MIKKIVLIIVVTMIMTSCDRLLSFFISPGYYIPFIKTARTVDMANSRIIGDPIYFNPHDTDDNIFSLYWNILPDSLLIQEYWGNGDSYLQEFPFELSKYDNVNSPLFYFSLFFGYDYNPSFNEGIIISTPVDPPLRTISLGWDNDSDIWVDFNMVTSAITAPSYTLPESAYMGIDGSGATTELTGGLNILSFDISANHDFVTGQATCVFSNTDPAGLLYMVYYHSNGLISLIYAHEVTRTGVLNYFPDGHFEYIWSVYRND